MPRNGIKKQFWLSEKHVKKLKDISQKTLVSETSVIRFLIDGYHPRDAPGCEFYDSMNKLWDAANGLREAATLCREREDRRLLIEKANGIDDLTNEIEKKFLMPVKVEYDMKEEKITEMY